MDEYLRNRYKKVDGGDSAEPAAGRYVPPPPERLYRQPARPMFPVNPRPPEPAYRPEPKAEPLPAPVQHHQPVQPHQPPAASHQDIPAAREHPAAEHHARRKRRFGFVKILITLLILGAAGGGGYYYLTYVKSPVPISRNLIESAGFPVYYPTALPGSYSYQAGSATNEKGLFNYKIADGSNGVVVNEQARPGTNFNPSALPKFSSITVGGDGTALIGTSGGVMTVIYNTPTTLINITAINDISRADMISIAQNLSAIKLKQLSSLD